MPRQNRQKVFCIKGMPGQDKPYTAPPKKQKIIVRQIAVGTCWQYQIGVDSGKEIIMDNLRVQTPGAKYCHFPKRDDYGSAYFTGLLSETKVYDPNKSSLGRGRRFLGMSATSLWTVGTTRTRRSARCRRISMRSTGS